MRLLVTASSTLAVLLIGSVFVADEPAASESIPPTGSKQRLRVIVETDAGGDPDDEQSLVRFLLYTNEWDVEGIIANRETCRPGENLNPVRTGLGVVQRQVRAYGECYEKLVQHDRRYPKPATLMSRTVANYPDVLDGVDLLMNAVESRDTRPVWFLNWGTGTDTTPSVLVRALEQVRREGGEAGYIKFKRRIRLSSSDEFGEQTYKLQPPFPFWVDTFQPEIERKRWYHRFSAVTATAGGFDVRRDVLRDHGPLGAMYPLNTTHPQKEGDTMTFLYLMPTGMNDPDHPEWGSWAGRYGPRDTAPGKPYWWANQYDTFNGMTSRENTLGRWAAHLQNDFRARLDWCVTDRAGANHPPAPNVAGNRLRTVRSGDTVRLDARGSTDPDGQPLTFEWSFYPEAGTYRGLLPEITDQNRSRASFVAPRVEQTTTIHLILMLTDAGEPALTRYGRVVVVVKP
jgi:hypothetical protein